MRTDEEYYRNSFNDKASLGCIESECLKLQ